MRKISSAEYQIGALREKNPGNRVGDSEWKKSHGGGF